MRIPTTLQLHQALSAVAPVDGVSSDGRIDFASEATTEQRAAAQAIVDLWDWERGDSKAYLSGLRYEKETQGFSIDGQRISSQRDEMGHWYPRFASAYAYLQGDTTSNPTGQYPYKPKDGDPVIFTAAQAVRAYQCLAWYINACFAVEAMGVAMLGQGMTLDEVLAALQWPQTTFAWEAPE